MLATISILYVHVNLVCVLHVQCMYYESSALLQLIVNAEVVKLHVASRYLAHTISHQILLQ